MDLSAVRDVVDDATAVPHAHAVLAVVHRHHRVRVEVQHLDVVPVGLEAAHGVSHGPPAQSAQVEGHAPIEAETASRERGEQLRQAVVGAARAVGHPRRQHGVADFL